MKYLLRDAIQIDSFSDGEMVIYDQLEEKIHVLNVTAALALNTILSTEDEQVDKYVKKMLAFDPNVPIAVLENDFYNILSMFIKENIIIIR